MDGITVDLAAKCILATTVLLLLRSWSNRRRLNLPPGPKGLPLIGNVLDMPKLWPWKTFGVWSKTYGSIVHLNMLGQSMIIINSSKVARDLLDKRSNIYSDRPKLEMLSLAGYDRYLIMLPYGHEWRQQRKLIAQDLTALECRQYFPLQERETRLIVRNIVKDSASFVHELRLRVGIIIVRATYGYYAKSLDDPIIDHGLQTMHNGSIAAEPGRFLVDIIPWLKHVPSWLPGTGFLQTAHRFRKNLDDTTWIPFNFCKDNLHTDRMLMPNICGNALQKMGGVLDQDQERQLALAACTVLGGGLDSSISVAITFFMFMILKPDIQKKAQGELDRVVGKDRLPSITDKADLPYLRSVITEACRFGPPLPLSVPHTLTQDDIYEDMFIPKGSVILPNVWHMLRDPELYQNPNEFIPERYEGNDVEMEKVKSVMFGFGRRTCPGSHFAEGTLFSLAATTLATCDILPGLDENGKECMPDPEAYMSTTISLPEPFPVRLRPRSSQAATLLAEVSTTIE